MDVTKPYKSIRFGAQERLPPELTEYLSVVRDLRFYDRELRRDTLLSYQLAFFLRNRRLPDGGLADGGLVI